MIGARVSGVTATGVSDRIAGKFERRESRYMTKLLRGNLVDRDANMDILTGGLSRTCARQKCRVRPRVIASAVVAGRRILVRESADHLQVLLHRL